jgi:hypothetical protein
MDTQAAHTALRRAVKRARHAQRALGEAQSERAQMRHARRLQQARRAMGEATRLYEVLALTTPD